MNVFVNVLRLFLITQSHEKEAFVEKVDSLNRALSYKIYYQDVMQNIRQGITKSGMQ